MKPDRKKQLEFNYQSIDNPRWDTMMEFLGQEVGDRCPDCGTPPDGRHSEDCTEQPRDNAH